MIHFVSKDGEQSLRLRALLYFQAKVIVLTTAGRLGDK